MDFLNLLGKNQEFLIQFRLLFSQVCETLPGVGLSEFWRTLNLLSLLKNVILSPVKGGVRITEGSVYCLWPRSAFI